MAPDDRARRFADEALAATGRGPLGGEEVVAAMNEVVNRGRKQELDGQSGLPPMRRYSIPDKPRPGERPCPYCVKRPIGAKGLRDHCRAQHPDKPEAR